MAYRAEHAPGGRRSGTRSLVMAVIAVVALIAVVTPAAALRVAGRSNFNGVFRDNIVCTDGIAFDIGLIKDGGLSPEQANPGDVAEGTVTEEVVISTVGDLVASQDFFDTPQAGQALSGSYVATGIANDDPTLTSNGQASDFTEDLVWLSSFEASWPTTLTAGQTLYVYMVTAGSSFLIETITVAECALFRTDQGCSHGFWKNHPEDWPAGWESFNDDFIDRFDVGIVDAMTARGKGSGLIRQSAAGILNALSADIGYRYSTSEILAPRGLKTRQLNKANNAGCPL